VALVKDPVARARSVNSELAAARLHTELEAELGLNDQLPDGWEQQAEQAVGLLEQRFGGAEHLRDVDTAGQGKGGWTPSLSPGARRGEGSRQPAAPRRGDHAQRPPRRAGGPRTSPRRGPLPRTVRRLGGQAIAGTATASELIMYVLGGTLAIVVLQTILRNAQGAPRGRAAVEVLARGVNYGIDAFVRPVDPLAPRAAGQPDALSRALGAPLRPDSKLANRPLARSTPTTLRPAPPQTVAAGQALLPK
jgi:hypothetical protein